MAGQQDTAGQQGTAAQAGTAGDGNGARRDVADLGYEQARDELLEVVRALEGGGVPLEESLALWERGEALAARCQAWLDGARERLAAAREPAGRASGGPAPDDASPEAEPPDDQPAGG